MITLVELMILLDKQCKLNEQQKYRISADIKRLMYSEQHRILTILKTYFFQGRADILADEKFIRSVLNEHIEVAAQYMDAPDKDLMRNW